MMMMILRVRLDLNMVITCLAENLKLYKRGYYTRMRDYTNRLLSYDMLF